MKKRKRKSALKVILDGVKTILICIIIISLFALPVVLINITGDKSWGLLYIATLGLPILLLAGDGIHME
jgi:hypothetical protein